MSRLTRAHRYFCRWCDEPCVPGGGKFTAEHGFLCAGCFTLWRRGEVERLATIPVGQWDRPVVLEKMTNASSSGV